MRYWLLRGLATVTAVTGIAQPIFAGRFLSGSYSALEAHRGTGIALAGLTLLTALAAVPVARRERRWAPVRMAAMVTVLTTVQNGLGFARVLGLHVPLGVLIVGGVIGQAILAWRPSRAPAATTPQPAVGPTTGPDPTAVSR
jgi:hypothetical protein